MVCSQDLNRTLNLESYSLSRLQIHSKDLSRTTKSQESSAKSSSIWSGYSSIDQLPDFQLDQLQRWKLVVWIFHLSLFAFRIFIKICCLCYAVIAANAQIFVHSFHILPLKLQESHIHSLLNVLRYCNLDESLHGEDSLVSNSALEELFLTRELDYMSNIVLRMFENTEVWIYQKLKKSQNL